MTARAENGPRDPRRRREPTLQGQLVVLLILFTVGPLVLTNAWGYLQSRRYLVAGELRNVRNVAALEAVGVYHFVREKHRLVASTVAGNQHLFGLLRTLATPDPAPRAAVEQALVSQLKTKADEDESIEELYILSPAQTSIASSHSRLMVATDPSVRMCFRRGRLVAAIDGIDYSGPDPALLLSAPITDTSGEFLGVFCARVRFNLRESIELDPQVEATATTLSLIGPGDLVVAVSPYRPETLDRPPSDRAAGWQFGMTPWDGRFVTESGRPVVAAYAPIPELGWGVLVETPVATALASLDLLKWQAAAFALVLSTLVVLSVVIIARRLSRPMRALAEAAHQAAAGALGVSVPPGGTAEVADLARSFNRMSTAVKDSHELLESRIRERTIELETSRAFEARLLDSINVAVVVVDRGLTIVKANRAARLRYGDDLGGRSYRAAFGGGESDDEKWLTGIFDTGRPARSERLEKLGEASEVVNLQMFPVVSPGGEVEAVVQLRRIVTDERRLQAQLIQQEKLSAFGLLAAGVAHEIGNPLAAIESQVRLAQEAPVPGRVDQTLDVVASEVRRIGRLLHDLISFTRRRDERPGRVSVEQVLADVAGLIENDPRSRQVKVELRAGGAAAPVAAKEEHLVQVFLNLGLNALDSMPAAGGVLTFETSHDAGRVVVRIRDTGGGVADEARGHLFEPFFTTKAPGRGTGLGLFVSKGLVEGMNGSLELESTGASGSVFRVELPVAAGWSEERAA